MIARECVSSAQLSPCTHIINGAVETLYVWDDDLFDVIEGDIVPPINCPPECIPSGWICVLASDPETDCP